PKGKRLVFMSDRDGDEEIYTTRRDGTGVHQLTHNTTATDSQPVWSPNGKEIAFNSDRDGDAEIFVMRANGTHQHALTHNADDDRQATYSPPRSKIAFPSARRGHGGGWGRRSYAPHQHHLPPTNTATATNAPALSPNGRLITWSPILAPDLDRDVFVMRANGTHQHPITHNDLFNDQLPDWQPLRR